MWPFRTSSKPTRPAQQVRSVRLVAPALRHGVRAKYDAAQTTADNARHWSMADSLSADAAGSPVVRRKLRERARYEVANNSYAKGIVLTLANDCIGTGPRLQLLSPDSHVNDLVENAFTDWARSARLAEKLRTMRMAKATDGEAFAILVSNPRVDSPVKLDVQLVEADRVTSPFGTHLRLTSDIDGLYLDEYGNPQKYAILRDHPGAPFGGNRGPWADRYDLVDADSVIHWFRADRPGQHRGIPELTPALPLFAQLRRYTLAVIAAAETAADFAAVLFTDSPANGEAQALEPMDVVDLEPRVATVLPDGWRLGQIEAQQPTTRYGEFKREVLGEIARCLVVPINVVTGDSSQHNYASGRLDHQTYFKSVRVEQSHAGEIVLNRILRAWIDEAMLMTDFAFLRQAQRVPHCWFFDGTEHVDPAKEANAQATRLGSLTTTLAIEYAKVGLDWENELRQVARERSLMRELGLTLAQAAPGQSQTSADERDDEPNATDKAEAYRHAA